MGFNEVILIKNKTTLSLKIRENNVHVNKIISIPGWTWSVQLSTSRG